MDDIFSSVAASSASNAWAVGGYDDSQLTLTGHWNGTSWKLVPSPKSPPWAVGDYIAPNGDLTLTERWNGTKWHVVPSPSK